MTVISRSTAPRRPAARPTIDQPSRSPSLRPSPLRTALRLAADPSRWRPHVDFDPDRRYYRRLLADEHHEAWLLTWLPGQGTHWHDHGGSGGAFVVLQGALVEGTAVHGRRARHPAHPPARGGPRVRPRLRAPGDQRGARPGGLPPRLRPRLEVQHDYVSDDGILRRIATRREGDDW